MCCIVLNILYLCVIKLKINQKQLKLKNMKRQSNNLFALISTEQVKNLTSVVKETLAIDFNYSKNKTFTAADLWNIQRQGKSRIQRRFSF
jgi:hypothetical protein